MTSFHKMGGLGKKEMKRERVVVYLLSIWGLLIYFPIKLRMKKKKPKKELTHILFYHPIVLYSGI